VAGLVSQEEKRGFINEIQPPGWGVKMGCVMSAGGAGGSRLQCDPRPWHCKAVSNMSSRPRCADRLALARFSCWQQALSAAGRQCAGTVDFAEASFDEPMHSRGCWCLVFASSSWTLCLTRATR